MRHLSRLTGLSRLPRLAGPLVIAGAFSIAGCSYLTPEIVSNNEWVYKIDIQQGTVVTQEMQAQLREGMTHDQVRFVLGTPPLTDIFHANRWDYTYRYQPGRGPVDERRFSVFFDNERLSRWEGDPLPTEREFVASRLLLNATQAKLNSPTGEADGGAQSPADDGSDGPSLWQRIKGWFGAQNSVPSQSAHSG